METRMQIIGISIEELKVVIKEIVHECLHEVYENKQFPNEKPITMFQVMRFLGISRPTLNKYISQGLIRRHDLGKKKKIFYKSELDEDIKKIKEIIK